MADQTPRQEAESDAKGAVENFIDEIVKALIDDGEAPTDITDRAYDESYHHESHIDRSYNLLEAAQVLDDLSRFEETDSSLWEGQDPREAVGTQAAYTYGNAVYSYFQDEMGTVNDEVGPVAQEMTEERASIERQIESFEDIPERDDAQEQSLDALRIRLEAFDVGRKKRLKTLVLEAIGRKKKARGPKDWNP